MSDSLNELQRESAQRLHLALNLIRVLMWPNPNGLICDHYVPPWMTAECEKVLAEIPAAALQAEMDKDPGRWPSDMLIRYRKHVRQPAGLRRLARALRRK